MSTTQQPGKASTDDAKDAIDLGGGRSEAVVARRRRHRRPRPRGVPSCSASPATTRRPSTAATWQRLQDRPPGQQRLGEGLPRLPRLRRSPRLRRVTIEGVGIEDGNQLDQATADGQYIANIYQHKHWLKQVTDSTGMSLTALGEVFQWSLRLLHEARLPRRPPEGLDHRAAQRPREHRVQGAVDPRARGKLTFRDGVDP